MTLAMARCEAEPKPSVPIIDHHQAARILSLEAKQRLTDLAVAVCDGSFRSPNEVENLEGELQTLARTFGREPVEAFYAGRLGLFSQAE